MTGSGPFAKDERCQDFVRNLVRLRGKYGWSQPQLAAECHFSSSVISNIEAFQRAPLVDHGRAIDEAFGLTGMFIAKARLIQSGAYPDAFKDFPEQEASAHDLCVYEHSLVPGLLQTEAYTRAVFDTLTNVMAEDVDRLVSARMARQEALFGEGGNPPRLWAMMEETVLDRQVGSAEVMRDQCEHILEVVKPARVSLVLLPPSAGGHIGLEGACTLVERHGTPRVVNLADFANGRVSEDPDIVQLVALRFRWLQQEAMPSGVSRDIVERKAERWQRLMSPDGARALSAAVTADSA